MARTVARARARAGAGIVLAPVAATLLACGWGIDRGSMWLDEEASYDAAHRSPAQIVALVHHTDVVHAAYYLLLHGWVVLGSLIGGPASAGGEVWLRVPSLLAAAVSAGLVAAIGRRLVSSRAGLLAGLLWPTLPFVTFYAQEARSYALVATAVLAATYLLVRAVSTVGGRSRGWWVGYAVAVVVAQTLNELAVLVLAAHLVTLAVARVPRRTWLRWGACVAGCVVLLLPLAWASERQSAQISWVTRPTVATVGTLLRTLLGPGPVVIVVLAVLVAVGLTTRRTPSAPLGLPAVAGPLLVGPPLVLLLVSLVDPLYVDRYVFYAVAGVPLLAGAGLDRIASMIGDRLARRHPSRFPLRLSSSTSEGLGQAVGRWLAGRLPERLYDRIEERSGGQRPEDRVAERLTGWRPGPALAGLGCVVVVAAVLVAQLPTLRELHTVRARAQDLAGAAAVVHDGARTGDGVVFLPAGLRATALAYPADFTGVADLTLGQSPDASATLRGTERSLPSIRAAMLAAPRIWLVGKRVLQVDPHLPEEAEEVDLLGLDFHRVQRVVLHGLVVALYARNG